MLSGACIHQHRISRPRDIAGVTAIRARVHHSLNQARRCSGINFKSSSILQLTQTSTAGQDLRMICRQNLRSSGGPFQSQWLFIGPFLACIVKRCKRTFEKVGPSNGHPLCQTNIPIQLHFPGCVGSRNDHLVLKPTAVIPEL